MLVEVRAPEGGDVPKLLVEDQFKLRGVINRHTCRSLRQLHKLSRCV
jgi:hypothetical protein